MRRLVVLGLIAACTPASAPVVANAAPQSPPYLALFERGRSWTLPIEVASGTHPDAFVLAKTERGSVSCAVADVRRIGDANVARLACAKPHDDLSIAGSWVAEPAGLYHPAIPIDQPDDLATLGDDDLLLQATPAERAHNHADEGTQQSIEAFPFARAWCVRETTIAGEDRRSYALCFDSGGVTGGTDLVVVAADATWRRATFGKAPPDPDDPTQASEDRD
jgi:hypothetical protein